MLVFECLVKKDDGGTRILAKNIFSLNDFLQQVKPQEQEFADIKVIKNRKDFSNTNNFLNNSNLNTKTTQEKNPDQSTKIKALEITITNQKSILPLQTILAQKVSINPQEGITIFLLADGKKILLPQKYQLNIKDIFHLQNIPASINIKKIV
jgi:hypothetical protein